MIVHRIPQKLHNRLVLGGYHLTTLPKISADVIAAHFRQNVAAIQNGSFFTPGTYIENQAEWDSVPFGSATRRNADGQRVPVTMADAGCGVFAVCNLFLYFGKAVDARMTARLIRRFEAKGAAARGRFGISPKALCDYLRESGYPVFATRAKTEDGIRGAQQTGDAFIVTCYNNARSAADVLHTVAITKESAGFVIHNGYRTDAQGQWCASGAYPSLYEAVTHVSPKYRSLPVQVLGVRKPAGKV